jgi:hypothetical protein
MLPKIKSGFVHVHPEPNGAGFPRTAIA